MNHDEYDLIETMCAAIRENARLILAEPHATGQVHITWDGIVRLSVQHQLPARKMIPKHQATPQQRPGTPD